MKSKYIKRLTCVFFISMFLSVGNSFALQISEVMYDPAGSDTGREWIEVYNDTDASIDLTSYKLFEANTNHGIAAYGSGGNNLGSHEYAVIVDNPVSFLADHAGFSGKIFDSSFSLSNSGETIELRLSGTTVYSLSYIVQDAANGTGNTINLDGGNWIVYTESPAAVHGSIKIDSTTTNTNTNNSTSTNSTSTNSTTTTPTNNTDNAVSYGTQIVYVNPTRFVLGDLSVLVPKEIETVAGADTRFVLKILDTKKVPQLSNIYWSYGDGGSGTGASSTHVYKHEGAYTAFVEAETGSAYGIDQINVKVLSPHLRITEISANNVSRQYIIIKNDGSENVNIGGFVITTDSGAYTLSRQLLISAGKDLRLDGEIIGFTTASHAQLLYPNRQVLALYTEAEKTGEVMGTSTKKVLTPNINTESNATSSIKNTTKVDYANDSRYSKIGNKYYLTENLKLLKPTSTVKTINASSATFAISTTSSTTTTGEKNISKKANNWLYWLHEW
jgi:hypothetical protein